MKSKTYQEMLRARARAHDFANVDFEEVEKRALSYLDRQNIHNLRDWRRKFYGLDLPRPESRWQKFARLIFSNKRES